MGAQTFEAFRSSRPRPGSDIAGVGLAHQTASVPSDQGAISNPQRQTGSICLKRRVRQYGHLDRGTSGRPDRRRHRVEARDREKPLGPGCHCLALMRRRSDHRHRLRNEKTSGDALERGHPMPHHTLHQLHLSATNSAPNVGSGSAGMHSEIACKKALIHLRNSTRDSTDVRPAG